MRKDVAKDKCCRFVPLHSNTYLLHPLLVLILHLNGFELTSSPMVSISINSYFTSPSILNLHLLILTLHSELKTYESSLNIEFE